MCEIPQKVLVFGLPVHLLADYSSWLVSYMRHNIGAHVVTLNGEMTIQAERNPALAKIVEQADLVIPDGSGIILYLLLQGKHARRCPGIELAESLLHQSVACGKQDADASPWSVFFYGGVPGVAAAAAAMWQRRLPELAIAGTEHGYLSPTEEQKLRLTLQQQQPRLIYVGLGVPRQEIWIAKHRYLCPQGIWIGVGGSLDIWAGRKQRAPIWLRDRHLEWVYRLYTEPSRWRRMLALPQFAWRSLLQSLFICILLVVSGQLSVGAEDGSCGPIALLYSEWSGTALF